MKWTQAFVFVAGLLALVGAGGLIRCLWAGARLVLARNIKPICMSVDEFRFKCPQKAADIKQQTQSSRHGV